MAQKSLRRRIWRFANQSEFVRRLRERRYERFLSLLAVKPSDRILDVGAGSGAALERFNATNPIVAVDIEPRPSEWLSQPNVTVMVADGRDLPFAEREFPIVFCNSVIEHLPPGGQQAVANEIRRVGMRYFVQTPYRYFPVEPHFQTLFLHFMPRALRQAFHRHVRLGSRGGRWESVHLLTAAEFQRLFPDAEIYRERFLGFTKSLMAVRR